MSIKCKKIMKVVEVPEVVVEVAIEVEAEVEVVEA